MSHALLKLAPFVAALSFGWWIVKAIVVPERPCWGCHGTGKNRWSNEKRRGPCLVCGGENPWRMTFGARLVRGRIRLYRGRRDR